MGYSVETVEMVPVVKLAGRFDAYEVPEVDTWFETNAPTHGYAIVDASDVTFIDTRALSTLVKWLKKLRESGGDLKLVHLSNPVRVIFELSRLDKAFNIYTTLTDALADCDFGTDIAASPTPQAASAAPIPASDVPIVALSGRMDAFKVPDLQAAHGDLVTDETPHLIIDLSEVEFLDSAALAWLVKMLKETQAHKGRLVVVRSQVEAANRIFQLTQFDKVFTFTDSVEDAQRELAQ